MKTYAQLLIRNLAGEGVETPAREVNSADMDVIELAVSKLATYFDMSVISQYVAENSSFAPKDEQAVPQQQQYVAPAEEPVPTVSDVLADDASDMSIDDIPADDLTNIENIDEEVKQAKVYTEEDMVAGQAAQETISTGKKKARKAKVADEIKE